MTNLYASLDQESERLAMGLLQDSFHGCTIIAVTHRLRTVLTFDKVLILENGSVAEFDSPNLLLEKNSIFKALWDLQESS